MSPLAYVNESTKFVVAGAALVTLVTHPNVPVAWCLIGSVVNSIAGKLLKRLLNHARPTGAAKADPGMPSSHAVSLAYLSVYAASGLLQRGGGIETNPTAWPVPVWAVPLIAAGLVSTGMFFTWLRVALGYHTWPQVLAGYAMGAANAVAWFAASIFAVEPAAAASPSVRVAVYAGVGATSALFGRLAWRWVEETKEWARWRKKRAKGAE